MLKTGETGMRLFVFACCAIFFLSSISTHPLMAQYDDNIVVAQEWEGIYEILLRNDLEPSRHREAFIRVNSGKLNGDTALIAGSIYTLPDFIEAPKPPVAPKKPASYNMPVFGKKYANVPIIDWNLEGAVYYLVSGHGGPDPGAMGRYGPHTLSEDEYAYDVTLRLARNLISHGAQVYIIIQDERNGIRDEAILPMDQSELSLNGEALPLNQRARLKQRVDDINELYKKHYGAYQRLISIHVDSRSKGENIDVFFYHHHRSRSGEQLAKEIQKVFDDKYRVHQPGRPYNGTVSSRSGLYMIKNTLPPIVYIELGNIRNYRDQLRFVISNNRQALANWIELGLLRDFEKSKK
jgi:N-acetylmuramoyl-L-alanine amidase